MEMDDLTTGEILEKTEESCTLDGWRKLTGWIKLIEKTKKTCSPFVDKIYMSKGGNLFMTLRFMSSKKKRESYLDSQGNNRTREVIIKGTPLGVKRRCWNATINAMIKSEYICPKCGSKRKRLEKHCN
jgi:hypothetical protein